MASFRSFPRITHTSSVFQFQAKFRRSFIETWIVTTRTVSTPYQNDSTQRYGWQRSTHEQLNRSASAAPKKHNMDLHLRDSSHERRRKLYTVSHIVLGVQT